MICSRRLEDSRGVCNLCIYSFKPTGNICPVCLKKENDCCSTNLFLYVFNKKHRCFDNLKSKAKKNDYLRDIIFQYLLFTVYRSDLLETISSNNCSYIAPLPVLDDLGINREIASRLASFYNCIFLNFLIDKRWRPNFKNLISKDISFFNLNEAILSSKDRLESESIKNLILVGLNYRGLKVDQYLFNYLEKYTEDGISIVVFDVV